MYDISSIKCVTRKFFVVVVQKNGKEMTIKSAARPQFNFFYVLVAVAFQLYTILFAVSVNHKHIDESFAFSPPKSSGQLEKMAVDFFQNVYCLFVCNFVGVGQLDVSKRGIDLSLLTLLSTNSTTSLFATFTCRKHIFDMFHVLSMFIGGSNS